MQLNLRLQVEQWRIHEFMEHVSHDQRLASAFGLLLDHWLSIRPDSRTVPSRQALSPASLKAVLPHLMLIEYRPEAEEFRFRLIGTGIVEWTGQDNTGRSQREVGYDDAILPLVENRYHLARERGLPVYSEGRVKMANGRMRDYWRLVAPLSDAGGEVDLFAVIVLLSPDTVDRFGNVQWPPSDYEETRCALIEE